ncbi:uncharacterized protein [Gossypium hirsutum]|uniref:Uncharacterized protein n=1 Tax=Gossypium hirsutum TaxID=3635 RepID=A0A1U8PM66_GOSHI|nr:uncharacterized protein LOC107959766 [Gossypium hirsutum]
MDPDRATEDDVESNASAPADRATLVEKFVRANPNTPTFPPPPISQYAPVALQCADMVRREKPPVDKIRKQRAKEFQEEFWKKYIIQRFIDTKRKEFLELKNKNWQNATSRAQTTSVASVGCARQNKPECSQCGRRHFGECPGKERGCFNCGLLDHFIRDYPDLEEGEKKKEVKASSAPLRGRLQKNPGSGGSSRGSPKDAAVRSEGRALARTYAIRAHEEA